MGPITAPFDKETPETPSFKSVNDVFPLNSFSFKTSPEESVKVS